MLTVGSLFAGIGGFDLGLERAGMRCLWQCEIDPYCQRVLEKHWPDVLRVPDIRELRAGTVEPVDVICGGFPCQGISWAGLGLGLADERSGLWAEMLRVIRELRPRWVVVENVAALLARGLDVVLGGLAAIGYDAEWDCIPASAVGAPHRRDRIWIVAYPNGQGEHARAVDAEVGGASQPMGDAEGDGRGSRGARRPLAAGEGERESERSLQNPNAQEPRLEGSWVPRRPAYFRSDVADPDQERRGGRPWEFGPARGREPSDGGWWPVEPDVGRVADGVPARVDRLRSLGNALVPQVAEWIGWRIVDYEEGWLAA